MEEFWEWKCPGCKQREAVWVVEERDGEGDRSRGNKDVIPGPVSF